MPLFLSRHHRRGFTMIELLVTLGIIIILISLVTLAVVGANKHARRTLMAAQMQQISLALNSYQADFHDYPRITFYSAADPTGAYTGYGPPNGVAGANNVFASQLLCWALISPGSISDDGADGPGFRTFRDPNSTSPFPNNAVGRVYGPYLPADKFTIAANSRYGATPSSANAYEILDTWGNPILYYPAKAGQLAISAAGSFVADSAGGTATTLPLFDYGDNYQPYMTLSAMQGMLGADSTGKLAPGDTPATTGPFILWSAGPDGIFGTTDDVTTFNQ